MISNVNIQQSFNVSDHGIGNGNQDAKSVCDNYNSQPISTSMSTPINEANAMHVTGDNGFSIYERSIDFHANFGGDYNVATTKDTATRLVTSQIEPNLLLKNVNNNNHVTSTAAAREIENVHNYSKNLYSTDSTSYSRMIEKKSGRSYNDYDDDDDEEDDDDDDIDGNGDVSMPTVGKINGSQIDDIPTAKGKLDDDDKSTPDHHARRPMNAFLIFCKRHRAIVREKYPNLENRSITKILGDWWANLDQDEKLCYTSLAKQYKDAFFSANPNFKWYKLPAPPLRTLSTRPGNTDRPPFNYACTYDAENITNDSMHRTNGTVSINEDTPATIGTKSNRGANVGIFKLADETQMGGLNSLMASYDSKSLSGNNNLGEHDGELDNSINPSKMKLTPTNRTEPFTNMRYHAAKMQSQIDNQTNSHGNDTSPYDSKRPIKAISPSAVDFEDFVHHKLLTPEKNIFLEDENLKKSARACKGKRYLEFMSSGKISPSSKKLKVHHPHSPTSKATFDRDFKEYRQQYSTADHMYASHDESLKSEYRKMDGTDSTGACDPADSKLFDASDFDLEEKIRALPALSLDKYLSRKRETKKKKKINAKRPTTTKSPQTIGEAKERIRISMVGSQKRKARKESITRRDINHETMETVGLYDIVESPKVEEKFAAPLTTDNASDLFFLATIAEVAAGAVNATIGSSAEAV
ncbi:hypothetical protein HA402_003197 [Bradysia odoriphaga]|nr:hypothetical protein HA402_003197 [Bradysia odoriphaga]